MVTAASASRQKSVDSPYLPTERSVLGRWGEGPVVFNRVESTADRLGAELRMGKQATLVKQ